MKITFKKIVLFLLISLVCLDSTHGQNKAVNDSTIVKQEIGDDRNIMLNAASANAGPRNVNIGLPASVGGTTVLENGLPAVFFYWPQMSYKAWRRDATINLIKVRNLGETAVTVGDIGFSVNSFNNLGTDQFQGNIILNSNHFGLINASANISGPVFSNGWKYSIGAYINYDPGTFSVRANNINRYFADKTQIYKAVITKDYFTDNGKGSLSLFYKYAVSTSMGRDLYAPYRYHLDGSVSEINGFKIGNDNYMTGPTVEVRDAETGEIVVRDIMKSYGSASHTIDLIGKNELDNGLLFNYVARFHTANTGHFDPVMTGISVEGDKQNIMALASRKTPIKTFAGLFEVSKKSGKHEWKIGVNESFYSINQFVTEGVRYSQTVEPNPSIIEGSQIFNVNEYHDGTENKTALIFQDRWVASDKFTFNGGMRLEYLNLRGNYINRADIQEDIPYLSSPKTNIKEDWFRKAFMFDAIYNITNSFGLLADINYNELYMHLHNFSSGNDPQFQKSVKIPEAGIGVYYNHSILSLVSKATFIKRSNYRSTMNFTSQGGDVARQVTVFDTQTLGWTTDIIATPFKNFSLHFLLTLQSPEYKNFSGNVNFDSGETQEYNFNDNVVRGISKVLIEIDPSYQWKNLRLWGSARFFSKEYANYTNSLFFKGRWETFAGVNYDFSKNLGFSVTFVNLLNQRGAQGSISGADLFTEEQAQGMEGRILSGTYIRPFTAEFGLSYKF